MKRFTLNWKGWWLLRPHMTDVADLRVKCAAFAIMGARLKKVGRGIGASHREPVMFGVHKGDEPLRQFLHELQKKSLGVFVDRRCRDIRKHPTVYVAALPEDTDLGELGAILSVIYESVPYAPRHHAVPEPYDGEPIHVSNRGRNTGLPDEIEKGWDDPADGSEDSDRTHDAEIDTGMDPNQDRSIATEKVPHPDEAESQLPSERVDKPPLVETARLDKDNIPQGVETERVPKPSDEGDTRYDGGHEDDEAEILDEAGREV